MEAVNGTQKRVNINGKTQTIKIPAGVDDGSRIRFGDYDVVLDVRPDKRFRREGVNIVSEVEIPFTKAAIGGDTLVETVSDPINIRIPSGTQPDTVIRLRGIGVPYLRGSGRGDHYVKIKVVVPKHLTHRQKMLLEEFEEEGRKKKGWF